MDKPFLFGILYHSKFCHIEIDEISDCIFFFGEDQPRGVYIRGVKIRAKAVDFLERKLLPEQNEGNTNNQ